MPRSLQSRRRRQLSKLRATLSGQVMAIDARVFARLQDALQLGDFGMVKAAVAFGLDDEISAPQVINGVAIIPVCGVLCDENNWMVQIGWAASYQIIERQFRDALANTQVKSILFVHNSPGGSAIGCKRVGDQIFAARGKKPTTSYVQGMCGSADFYIAAATDKIVATADSLVASVGTIYEHDEYSGALKEYGVGRTVFTNVDSPKKGHGNSAEPLSDEAKATLQQFVNSYGRPFIEDVARYRGISPEDVIARYGQGDAIRADVAVNSGVIDAIVGSFHECLASMTSPSVQPGKSASSAGGKKRDLGMLLTNKIKAQLLAMGLITSMNVSTKVAMGALRAHFKKLKQQMPQHAGKLLKALQASIRAEDDDKPKDEDEDDKPSDEDDDDDKPESEGDDEDPEDEDDVDEPGADDDEDPEDEDDEDKPSSRVPRRNGRNNGKPGKPKNLRQLAIADQSEARLSDLRAAQSLINEATGYIAVDAEMVLDSHEKKQTPKQAMKSWNTKLASNETAAPTSRVVMKGHGHEQYAKDVIEALTFRADGKSKAQLSKGASNLVNRPLWAVAGECLALAGRTVDMYGDRAILAEQAMGMGAYGARQTFYSQNEGRQYVQASGSPAMRPGDFPNILSGLANKFLDTIELDDDYSYEKISALLPGGMNDFKPAIMINRGVVEELDEVSDAGQIEDLGLREEVLSYLFIRRFANKFGWTSVMIANDDLGAFAEGMIGLQEAWQVTQNRLVLDRFIANESLLDGNALFSDRANTGTGANPATNNNLLGAGNAPSDAQWEAMENLYADIGGIGTGRRVRGVLNVALVPSGNVRWAAERMFNPMHMIGEEKVATTTATMGLFRGKVDVVCDSELRAASAIKWWGLRNPTKLNTATVVRAYFNGYGTGGRREQWYDPNTKTTFVSLEGRIASAVKNWRYAVQNAGTGG